MFIASVFHDLGKKETRIKEGKFFSFPGHEKISVKKTSVILKKFDLTEKEKKIVLGIIKKHSNLHEIVAMNNRNIESQFMSLEKSCNNYIVELIILVMADTYDGYLKKTMPENYNFRINFYKKKLALLT